MKRKVQAERVLALCKLVKVRTYKSDSHPEFTAIDFDEREPETTFYVSQAGDVIELSFLYSGHNGDVYERTLKHLNSNDAESALVKLDAKLTQIALANAKKQHEIDAQHLLNDKLLNDINVAILK